MDKKKILIIGSTGLTVGAIAALAFFLNPKNSIAREAKKYIGMKEISPNKGFENKKLASRMQKYGLFKVNDKWCIEFTRMVLMRSLRGNAKKIVAALFVPSTQTTASNFEKFLIPQFYSVAKAELQRLFPQIKQKDVAKHFQIIANGESVNSLSIKDLKKGDILIWKQASSNLGHSGIISKIKDGYVYTIEGNVVKNSVEGVNILKKGIEQIKHRSSTMYLRTVIRIK